MKRLLLSGYYGYGNSGDEAVLAGLVAGFRLSGAAADLELTALSGAPGETRLERGIRAVDRYRPAALLPAIARCDLFLSGGGSLLQDVSSAHGIFYYLGVVKMAQMLGKKTMFIAQGIGPLKLPRSRRLVAAVANKLNAVTVRDSDSARLLAEIGVTRPPVTVTADPALLLFPSGPKVPGSFGVALRPWPGQETLADQVAAACLQSLSRLKPFLLPMQNSSDQGVSEQFARVWDQSQTGQNAALLYLTTGDLDALLSIVAGCDMMVGMRLHALILAAAAGTPSVALSYDPKVTAFMAASGQGDAVYDLSDSNSRPLQDLLAQAWAERSARTEALHAALPALRQKAKQNIEIALRIE